MNRPEKVTKYQVSLKNPRLLMQKDIRNCGETSAGTFKKDKENSDLNLGSSRTAYGPVNKITDINFKARTRSQMQQQRLSLDEPGSKPDNNSHAVQEQVTLSASHTPSKAISQSHLSSHPKKIASSNYGLFSEKNKSLDHHSHVKKPKESHQPDGSVSVDPDVVDNYAMQKFTFGDEDSRRMQHNDTLTRNDDLKQSENFDPEVDL